MKKLFVLSLVLLSAEVAAAETRQGVLNRLNNTTIKKVGGLNGFTLPEVLEILSDASGGRVNFMYMPHLGKNKTTPSVVTNASPRLPAVDPTTGLPNVSGGNLLPPIGVNPLLGGIGLLPPVVQPQEMAIPKIRGVRIKLRNVTLKQLLDITTMSFDKPVRYVVTEYGVIFIPREENKPILFNRIYQINPKRLNNMRPNK